MSGKTIAGMSWNAWLDLTRAGIGEVPLRWPVDLVQAFPERCRAQYSWPNRNLELHREWRSLWKDSGEPSKTNWYIIKNSKHDYKQNRRRLPNISRSFITGSTNRRNWTTYRQQNLRSDTMPIYSLLNYMNSIFDNTYHIIANRKSQLMQYDSNYKISVKNILIQLLILNRIFIYRYD